jgi:ubiquinone/menaquinone biosynthesis C-methylase UbiE
VFDVFVPVLIKVSGKNSDPYKYLLNSKKEFPEPDDLVKMFEQHGFKRVCIKNYLFGVISAQIVEKM